MSTARRNRDGNSDVYRGTDYHSRIPTRTSNDAKYRTASTITSVGREVANCKLRVDVKKALLGVPGTACIACRRQERTLQDGSSMTYVIQRLLYRMTQ